jgi:hypothetical protein
MCVCVGGGGDVRLQTNETDGTLPGCLTPQGPSATLSHAKPIIIQGALLAAKATVRGHAKAPLVSNAAPCGASFTFC